MPIERIRHVYHGSTAYVSDGYGAYHSRSTVMGGSAVLDAANNLHGGDRARPRRSGCGCGRREVSDRRRTVPSAPGGKSVPLAEFAGAASAEGAFLNKKHTYSYGAHAAHVAVDPSTGRVEIVDYVVVQDVGRVINPLTLHGQVIGSLVQGLGGAVLEDLVYDDQGQFLTGSLADYLLPTATDFPNLRGVVLDDIPRRSIRSAPRARARAASSRSAASSPTRSRTRCSSFGVEPRELPLSPPRVWELVQAARK